MVSSPARAKQRGRISAAIPAPPKTPKIAALTAAANKKQQQLGLSHGSHAAPIGGPSTVNVIHGSSQNDALALAPVVVESHRYEEWMKLATDNVSA